MKKQVGFIVLDGDGVPLMCGNYGDHSGNVLCIGGRAELFSDRRRAARAVKNTEAYSERHRLEWALGHKIVPVISQS